MANALIYFSFSTPTNKLISYNIKCGNLFLFYKIIDDELVSDLIKLNPVIRTRSKKKLMEEFVLLKKILQKRI